MDVSIVVPFLNEEESLTELYSRIKDAANQENLSFEVCFVDDGSTDKSLEVVKELRQKNSNIRY